MASVVPNPNAIRAFRSEAAFEAWLRKNHDRQAEVWIKIFKKATGKPTIDPSQAIDVALCWGWIDGIRKPFDEEAYLQRYTPRKARSRWSQINVERVGRLAAAGRMTVHGQRQIDTAKSDGRWAAAYPSPSAMRPPAELLLALAKNPKALQTFRGLTRQSVNLIAYRLHHLKSATLRAQRILDITALLARGEAPLGANHTRKKAARAK